MVFVKNPFTFDKFYTMRYLFQIFFSFLVFSCAHENERMPFTSVVIDTIYEDSLSIRAIDIAGETLSFSANKGVYGSVDLSNGQVLKDSISYKDRLLEFRAISHSDENVFVLSVGSPALLFKINATKGAELVYIEDGEGVFYDAMTFWNAKEGVAIGDSVNGCLSIIITRDGGTTWKKLSCAQLPKGIVGEGAFAASNTNIKTIGDKTWVATTSGRVLFSGDKGKTWQVFQTLIKNKEDTEGIYSIDFWNEYLGIAIGGDYTNPDNNRANKAITADGGKTWKLLADGTNPGYKSCVQFVSNTNGKEIVAVGFTGVSYSSDLGETWKNLSNEAFYTIRFLNDSTAYAAGKNRISKLTFR